MRMNRERKWEMICVGAKWEEGKENQLDSPQQPTCWDLCLMFIPHITKDVKIFHSLRIVCKVK